VFDELLEVVRRLRRECPWDRKQTIETTRPLMLNEAYELDEALGSEDSEHITEELGDYLFMGFFLAEVLEQELGLKLEDSLAGITTKLKQRHPHVYGDEKVRDADHVLENWERIKRDEGKEKRRESILDGLPESFPALKQSHVVQERCRRVGFDWTDTKDVLDKVNEEVEEVRQELAHGNPDHDKVVEEVGDLLFALVNLSRHLGVDAESALRDANAKFTGRFRQVEAEFAEKGRSLDQATLEEMDRVWDEVKLRAGRARGNQE